MRYANSLLILIACTMVVRVGAGSVLCIGLNDYNQYPDLKHAESDAIELAQAFTRLGHVVQTLTGARVTRANVLQALACHPEVVYFAGHAQAGRLNLHDGDLALADIASAGTILVLDCCYVGLGLKASGTVKILAAAEYEAFEVESHGLLTKYLLAWLGDGKCLSAETELTAYLVNAIGAETGGWQKPVFGFN